MSVMPTRDRNTRDLDKTGAPRTVLASVCALLVLVTLPCASAGATNTVSPLPASNYTVRPVCAAPAPGHAGCLALRLVPVTAAARARIHPLAARNSTHTGVSTAAECAVAYAPSCLTPQDLHSAYTLPTAASSAQTIAIVDAYNDLGAESDLEVYDKEFGLPECTEVNKCFAKVNQNGNGETKNLPFPQSKVSRELEEVTCETTIGKTKEQACKEIEEADGWAGEISLDIEVVHAVCQNCKIVLVEANSSSFVDLGTAEETAVRLAATEISDSWGGPEQGVTTAEDNAGPFNHPGTVITVAAGDNGYLDWAAKGPSERGFADYPASSPHVVAVGGTRLSLTAGGAWKEETVWNGNGAGGGGCSTVLTAPAWQQSVADWLSVGCGEHRAVADVSADADPYTGVAIYDSTPESMGAGEPGWVPIGGTSLASPLIASVFALAGGPNGVEYPAQTLYENLAASPQSLHDVELGSNGECSKPFNEETGISSCSELQEAAQCSGKAICLAQKGYDGPSGVGTPNGIVAFQPLTEAAKKKFEERKAEEQKRKETIEAEEKSKSKNEVSTGGSGGEESKAPSTTASGGALTTGGSSSTTTSLGSPDLTSVVPVLSALTLTRNATVALSHGRPRVSRIAFAFTLNVAVRIRVTLAKLVLTHGRHRWQTLPYSLMIAGTPGRDRAHLSAHGTLAPGRYRLTLAPVQGVARTLTFRVG